MKWVHYDDAMVDFRDVIVCVQLQRAQEDGRAYIGGSLLFRPDDLEHTTENTPEMLRATVDT